jgi:hypothetical protein
MQTQRDRNCYYASQTKPQSSQESGTNLAGLNSASLTRSIVDDELTTLRFYPQYCYYEL